jgi:uncharacterized repeat protein (TIGR03803 family)
MTNFGKQSIHYFSLVPRPIPVAAMCLIACTLFVAASQAQTYNVLYAFRGQGDGYQPYAGLTMDAAGRLYGTTSDYPNGTGTAFELAPRNGGWLFTTLVNFNAQTGDQPYGAVVFGPGGALYGTTVHGGQLGPGCDQFVGCGTVYRLTPPISSCRFVPCMWHLTTLHAFEGTDGSYPQMVNPVFDARRNLYGTTIAGGFGAGTVFKVTPSGQWTLVHSFTGADGSAPTSGVIFDQTGNLYGTTSTNAGGAAGGTIYQLVPSGGGWAINTLHAFQPATDGYNPRGGVIRDAQGNLYGATTSGGPGGGGTIYELSPSGGSWTFTVLHSFSGGPNDGPWGTLTMDSAGNLYGTAYNDGIYGYGSVFKMTPGNGGWTFTDLHDFDSSDGANPIGGVTLDANANLYGTASEGGTHRSICQAGCGMVWEITP